MHICPIWIQSGLIPIHFQRWFWSGLNWISQFRVRTKRAWHACLCQLLTASALLRATCCVPRICSTWEALCWLAEVNMWRGCHGSCVEVCPLEVNVHAWIRFCTMQCVHDWCALDLHWIRIGQFSYWTSLNLDSVWTGHKNGMSFTESKRCTCKIEALRWILVHVCTSQPRRVSLWALWYL